MHIMIQRFAPKRLIEFSMRQHRDDALFDCAIQSFGNAVLLRCCGCRALSLNSLALKESSEITGLVFSSFVVTYALELAFSLSLNLRFPSRERCEHV